MSLTAGVEVGSTELEMWLEELAIDPWARGFAWTDGTPPASAADFSVVVIGAGMGGLNAAVHLKRAGIPFTVLEKNSSVGGTWYENRYPGARVDSPSRIYTHVYGANFTYPYPFCPQAENEKYFNWIADTFDLRGRHRVPHRGAVDRLGRGSQAVDDHGRSTRRPRTCGEPTR